MAILKPLSWVQDYSKKKLKGDFFAGLTVGVLLIPQSMAYALIAGLPVVYGLYASIVPQVIYAFLDPPIDFLLALQRWTPCLLGAV